jgi:hypothetical protein
LLAVAVAVVPFNQTKVKMMVVLVAGIQDVVVKQAAITRHMQAAVVPSQQVVQQETVVLVLETLARIFKGDLCLETPMEVAVEAVTTAEVQVPTAVVTWLEVVVGLGL